MESFFFSSEESSITIKDGTSFDLQDVRAFELLSQAWLRAGWDTKYVYGFSWQGRPLIQLPEDMLRIQEVIYEMRPDVIVETGVAHGGSLMFYATLCLASGVGRVVGIDIEIRPHNREAIEKHELSRFITLVEGNSIDRSTFDEVKSLMSVNEKVMLILDSNHSRDHVRAELELYSQLVGIGGCIVVCDGIMAQVVGAPRSQTDWDWNNPLSAIDEFLERHAEFESFTPTPPFNEGLVKSAVTYWPRAYLRRAVLRH